MERNDYRRSLIMLRSLLNGYSGHGRIEIRTMMGSLSIRACIPSRAQSVRAALVGRRTYEYFAYPIGDLRRDMRGQAGLTFNFDPRDIGGRMLDAYSYIAIVTINEGECTLAMVGSISGAQDADLSRVRDAVCALYAPQPRAISETEPASQPAVGPVTEAAEPAVAALESAAVAETAVTAAEHAADGPQPEGLVWDLNDPDDEDPEPEPAAFLPPAFINDGWSYARVSLPVNCGYGFAYVGTPSCGGEFCCALPGPYSPEPPVGMEDYTWSEGYWISCYDALTDM